MVLGSYLYSSYTIHCILLGRMYFPLGLMIPFLDIKELPQMPSMAAVGDSGAFSLAGLGGNSDLGG